MPEPVRLAVLVPAGGAVYCLWLALFARATVRDLIELVRGRRAPADPALAV